MSALITPEARVLDALVWACSGRDHAAGREIEARVRVTAELERQIACGLVHRIDGATRFFDLYEVFDAMRTHRGPTWLAGEVASLRDRVESFSPRCEWATPRRFEVTTCREVGTGGRRPSTRMRFGIPLPVAERDQRALTFATADLTSDTTAVVSDGLLDVRATVPEHEPLVRVTVRIGVTCTGVAPRVPAAAAAAEGPLPPEVLQYLETTAPLASLSSQLVAHVTPRLTALAAEIAGPARHPWAVVERLWEYLFRTMRPGYVRHHRLAGPEGPLEAALDGGVADCRISATLMTALCRARGIPARVVGGLHLFRYCPASHWWSEVFVGGDWVPVDLESWILGGGEPGDPWSRAWLGELDYRLVTERPPSSLSLGSGVRFTNDWHMESAITDDGSGQTTYVDARTGALLFRETHAVRLISIDDTVARSGEP